MSTKTAAHTTAHFIMVFLLVSLNLRMAFSAADPLLTQVRHALHMGITSSGLFALLPIMALGIAAPMGARLVEWIRPGNLITWAMLLATAGVLWRSSGYMAGLFCGTIIIGLGLGVAGSVILGIVKQAIPTHLPEVMSAYTACVSLGTAIGSGAAVPIARLLEGWQAGLMFWALPMLLATILWAFTMHRSKTIQGGQSTMRAPMLPLLRKRSARMVTLYYLFRVASSWLLVVWLVTLLHLRGMSTEKAGLLLSLTTACQIPCALISGIVIRWLGSIQRLMVIATLLAVAACWGLLVAPEGYWLVSAIALGAGLGSIFSVGMTLIATTEPGESGTIALSGLAQGIGFTGGGLLAWAAGAGMGTANPGLTLALLYSIFALSGLYFGLRCGKSSPE